MSNKIEIEKTRLHTLEENSVMLSRIAGFVREFAEEGDTTLMAVVRLLADYHDIKTDSFYSWIDTLEKEKINE